MYFRVCACSVRMSSGVRLVQSGFRPAASAAVTETPEHINRRLDQISHETVNLALCLIERNGIFARDDNPPGMLLVGGVNIYMER